jgi:predicted transcriptional regulator
MTNEQKKTICDYVKKHPEKTLVQIAKELCISKSTVERACKGTLSRGRGPKLKLKGTK